jgi:hypothetical protein
MRVAVFIFALVIFSFNSCRKESFDIYFGERLIGMWSCKSVEVYEWNNEIASIDTNIATLNASSVIKLNFKERGKLELFRGDDKLSARRVPHWAYHSSDAKRCYDLILAGNSSGFQGDELSLFFDTDVRDTFRVEAGYLNVINECDYAGSHGLNYVFVKE